MVREGASGSPRPEMRKIVALTGVILAIGYGLDHAFPGCFNINRGAIQQLADGVPGLVIPTGRFS